MEAKVEIVQLGSFLVDANGCQGADPSAGLVYGAEPDKLSGLLAKLVQRLETLHAFAGVHVHEIQRLVVGRILLLFLGMSWGHESYGQDHGG